MARGSDDRAVETSYERKSVGAESTFARDLPDGGELRAALRETAAHVADRMKRVDVLARTVAIKLRYANFKTITRQASAKTPVAGAQSLENIASQLLDAVVQPGDRFRLLGIQCSQLTPAGEEAQPRLWEDDLEISARNASRTNS
jgi:DNA polymerase-4